MSLRDHSRQSREGEAISVSDNLIFLQAGISEIFMYELILIGGGPAGSAAALLLARAGWSVMYHGDVSCCHLEQRASKNVFSADAWKHFRSYVRFLHKWGCRPSRAALHRATPAPTPARSASL
jgi:choline dehydrogenase-like flavoprotein